MYRAAMELGEIFSAQWEIRNGIINIADTVKFSGLSKNIKQSLYLSDSTRAVIG